jgi:hypothetical protein
MKMSERYGNQPNLKRYWPNGTVSELITLRRYAQVSGVTRLTVKPVGEKSPSGLLIQSLRETNRASPLGSIGHQTGVVLVAKHTDTTQTATETCLSHVRVVCGDCTKPSLTSKYEN